jgi:hypothetical protein
VRPDTRLHPTNAPNPHKTLATREPSTQDVRSERGLRLLEALLEPRKLLRRRKIVTQADAQVYPTQLAWLRHRTRRIERLGLTGVLLMLVGRGYPSRGPRNVFPSAQLRFGGDAGQLLIRVS